MMYTSFLQDQIDRELKKTDYVYDEYDRNLLLEMFGRINKAVGVQYGYLAEIALHPTPGVSSIVIPFFNQFHSEAVRAYLLPQITLDPSPSCGKVIYSGYIKFKNSDCYISDNGRPAPAYIISRYDRALSTIKRHELKWELFSLAKNPRDVVYLPTTMKKLASWKFQAMEDQIIRYYSAMKIPEIEFGFTEELKNSNPNLPFMRRQLLFFAIACSPYYPTEQIRTSLQLLITSADLDISNAAKKALEKVNHKKG